MAASPMVSGYGNFEEITDVNYSVIVDCKEEDVDRAKSIISQMGGQLDNPNVSRYKTAMDNDINIDRAIDQLENNMEI